MFSDDLKSVPPRASDDTVNVFVETPKGSRHKYDIDDKGLVKIALELPEGVTFPFSFGFVPNTLAPDGDALDIVLITAGEVPARSLIEARLVGVLKMSNDESGEIVRNDRVVAVATMSRVFGQVHELEELRKGFAWDIEEFFDTYNRMIERPFDIVGSGDAEEARRMMAEAVEAAEAG